MDDKDGQIRSDPNETIESLARTVAHLAVQVTISQIQVRALGGVLEDSGGIASAAVADSTATIAREHARRYLTENLGAELAEMIDLDELEHQVVSYLSPVR